MKFINYLERITGVGIYPLTSFIMFFLFFIVVTIWVFKTKKSFMNYMSNVPLN